MAKDEITLSRREHRDLVKSLDAILGHHTNTVERRSVFDETHDAELHEDAGFDIHDCPHCSVITHAQTQKALIRDKVAALKAPQPVDERPLPPLPPPVKVASKRAKVDRAGLVKGPE